MRTTIFAVACLLLSTFSYAGQMYITDDMKITFRTGPGVDRKIISMLSSGQNVDVLKNEGQWTLVRLGDGQEGWVISRFLSSETPSRILLNRLQKKHAILVEQASPAQKELTLLKEENSRLESRLETVQNELAVLDKAHTTLKQESTEFLNMKKNYEKATHDLSEEAQKANQLDEQVRNMKLSHNIRWFLSGGGVLLLGILIGVLSKRRHRRSSLL